MIEFLCDNDVLKNAYDIAVRDIYGNIRDYCDGALDKPAKCLMAGADYGTPWTRDTAINVWNAMALLDRPVSKNTLLSVIDRKGKGYIIGGQYWDCVIWAVGAYTYILATGDRDFETVALSAISASLKKFEKEEFDAADGLFRGPAVYGDGIAAYPDKYARSGSSGIESWPHVAENKPLAAKTGVGIPMKALSTNCVYFKAYQILAELQKRAGKSAAGARSKADALKAAINKAFWNEKKGTYDYLAGECDHQEALGIAFALLFDVADARQKELVLKNAVVTPNGISCVEPTFERYSSRGGYGRHSGTIWPHAQGFFARAAFACGDKKAFEKELFLLAGKAVRDGQFYEIYHPDTGEVYGGLQGYGGKNDIGLWRSCAHQTWSATAYLSLIYYDLAGVEIGEGKATFTPYLPAGVNEMKITGLNIGEAEIDVTIVRGGKSDKTAVVDTTEKQKISLLLAAD